MEEKYDYEGIPAHIDGDHCSAWLSGYNAAVREANEIIKKLREQVGQ
jgi:hypothetical protein